MWLTNSSIGRKVIMSVTGISLVLFLTFHASMNVVALFSKDGYNMICEFLGANWYAVVATLGLAFLCFLHIVYAFILTIQNRKARGNNRYAVTDKPEKVEWTSQNMLVLGIIVLLGVLLHLYNFWYHMMWPELLQGKEAAEAAAANAHIPAPADGFGYIVRTFSCPVYVIIYVIWLFAIWFHLTHGFWSAIQTLGWSGKVWFNRWKCIGKVYVTIVMLMFLVVVLGFKFGCAPSLKKCGMEAGCCKTEQCEKATPCEKAHHCGEAASCEKADAACPCGEDCKCENCDGKCA